MARSKSSGRWMQEHFDDHYVKQSKEQGYRSRASFKLLELHEKDKLFRPGMTVVDLGAAPGGWSQVAAQLVGDTGRVVASDILPMDSMAGVEFVQGDFTNIDVQTKLLNLCENNIDTILSDMSPNKTGVKKVDQWKSTALCETVLHFAESHLKVNGNLLFKCFHGDGFEEVLKMARSIFKSVKSIKPDASRKNSTEIYLLCLAKKDKA